MRVGFFALFVIMTLALGYCARKAYQSTKKIGRAVAMLLCALIPPVIGNAIIIISSNRILSIIGYYTYFLGMNCVMFAVLNFTFKYCEISVEKSKFKIIAYSLLILDAVQILCNMIWGHAFSVQGIPVDGSMYYRLIPFGGQSVHRLIDYGMVGAILVFFILRTINSPRFVSERYSVILITIIITTCWESFYIFSSTPVDRSMIGFAVFGILVFYFSIYYRPMRLLDSMLSHIASEMPEALFFFDTDEHCIWANQSGIDLLGIENNDFEVAFVRLKKLFGEHISNVPQQHEVDKFGEVKTYMVEQHEITDDSGRLNGSFVSVRDNTSEQMTLRAEVHKATHDPLTGVYNRAGYNLLIGRMELWKTILLLLDGDYFKSINDTYGHEIGDKILQKIASTMKNCFRADDYVCRIGGDEFVVLMVHSQTGQREQIIRRIEKINDILSQDADGLPPITVSVGVAYGRDAGDMEELFEQADKALYETKSRGKKGFTFYEDLI